MAGPAYKRRPEKEEVEVLKKHAADAAVAYRKYMIGGDSAESAKFWKLYKAHEKKHAFMDKLLPELKKVVTDPLIKPMFEAFKKDRGRFFGFLWRNPIHYTDFITTVTKIRSTLQSGAAKEKDIKRLTKLVKSYKNKKLARKESLVLKVRKIINRRTGLSEAEYWKVYGDSKHERHKEIKNALRDSVIELLERPAWGKSATYHGRKLTEEVARRMPKVQARRCIIALREFLLTGDGKKYSTFAHIFNNNPFSSAFKATLTSEFRNRISLDEASGLKKVMDEYRAWSRKTTGSPSMNPVKFASMVKGLYSKAIGGKPGDVEALRKKHGQEVVDALLEIVSKGLAGRALLYFRDIIKTGNAASERTFLGLLKGKIATIEKVKGKGDTIEKVKVVMRRTEKNPIFWRTFRQRYQREMGRNKGLRELNRTFKANIWAIGVRDIVSELAKKRPDMKRLNNDYGPRMVAVVADNIDKLSWLMRNPADLRFVIEKRADADDKVAKEISRMKNPNKEKALATVYLSLVYITNEKKPLAATGMLDTLDKNFSKLAWMSGKTGQDLEQELTRRARATPADSVARDLLSKARAYATSKRMTLTEACQVLSDTHKTLSGLRAKRAALEKKHGKRFVAFVQKNLGHLYFVMDNANEIRVAMDKRTSDPFVFSLYSTMAKPLAYAIKDVYDELSKSRPDIEMLKTKYSPALLNFVKKNKGKLRWVSGDVADVTKAIAGAPKDRTMKEFKSKFFYSYSLAQFARAIAESRRSVAVKGLSEMDAHDMYGRAFTLPAVWEQVKKVPSKGKGIKARTDIVGNCKRLHSTLIGLKKHIKSFKALRAALPVIDRYITRWLRENEKIRYKAWRTLDKGELEKLDKQWDRLHKSVVTRQDLRYTVEMVFATIHLARTGADLKTGNVFTTANASADSATVKARIGWYNEQAKTGKQPIIRDMTAAIMKRASPRLYKFINKMSGLDYFNALDAVYDAVKGKDSKKKRAAIRTYGQAFVDAVKTQLGNLKLLESGTTSLEDLRVGENELYASIVLRCYRALRKPRPKEDKAAMVKLFGKGFVQTIEQNLNVLDKALSPAGAGLKSIKGLKLPLRRKLLLSYVSAYDRSIGSLGRVFKKQDSQTLEAMVIIYRVLQERPAAGASKGLLREHAMRVRDLSKKYGRLVDLVKGNMAQLGFLGDIQPTEKDFKKNLSADLVRKFRDAYARSEASKLPSFMDNLTKLGEKLPRIFLLLRQALVYDTNSDQVGKQLGLALKEYRKEFGRDDYLLKQYLNLDLLSKSWPLLRRHYQTDIPRKGIKSAEDLVKFLSNPETGQKLIEEGKKFFTERLETQYLEWRKERGISETTGEFSDLNIQNIKKQLSILDALYLGIALKKYQTGSFGKRVMVAAMESIIVINNRDPYLVGPFLLQVLPAFLKVAKDATTLELGLKAFNLAFTARYSEVTKKVAYSDALNRKYFLEVFARFAAKLPAMATVFSHTQLADELRLTPPPTGTGQMGGTGNPYLYMYKPGFWNPTRFGEEFTTPIGAYTKQLHLTPNIQLFPTGGLGVMQFTVDSGAKELFERMNIQLKAPGKQLFRPQIPGGLKINAIGTSTLIRRINQLFGPMPKDYEAYWLTWDVNASGYYTGEGGGVKRETGALAATAAGRAVTGGLSATATYTGTRAETKTEGEPVTTPTEETVTGTKTKGETHAANVSVMAGGLPIVKMLKLDLTTDVSTTWTRTKTTTTPTGGEPTTVTTTEESGRSTTKGTLETYMDICKKKNVAMLVYISGEYTPKVEGEEETGIETTRRMLQGRLYFIDQYGNSYQFAISKDDQNALNTFMYGGIDHKNVFASFQFLGDKMLSDKGVAGGFNGAALGFTIPTGGGDTFSALALGQLVRNMSSMSPVARQTAAATAITNLLRSRKHRDVYAAFYRGSETVTMDPEDPSRIKSAKMASATGELMWRRISLSPGGYQFEIRAAGGYPLTAALSAKVEWTKGKTRKAVGFKGGVSTINFLNQFLAWDLEATNLFATAKNYFAGVYGYSDNKAKDMGYMLAFNYMYSRMEDWLVRDADGNYIKDKSVWKKDHFISAMAMYWAKRHGFMIGAKKVPKWAQSGGIYSIINDAMTQIQRNPENQATILSGLAERLEGIFEKPIWNFSLGYGYDGQELGVYVFGGAQISDDVDTYVNLKSIFVFGRPAKSWLEIGGYGYTYPREIVVEDDTKEPKFDILQKNAAYIDATIGFGSSRWPRGGSHLYKRDITISARPDAFAALRDVYITLGAGGDKQRLRNSYGRSIVALVEKNLASLNWMVRPSADIQKILQKRRRKDSTIKGLLLFMPGRKVESAKVTLDEARMLREIYLGLRTPGGKKKMLAKYKRDLVLYIEGNSASLEWLLLPTDKVKEEFRKRARVRGTPAEKISQVRMRLPPPKDRLTGTEMVKLFQQNMVDVVFGCDSQRKSKRNIEPRLYSVAMARHLQAARDKDGKPPRSNTFYVLYTTARLRPGTIGSLIIGNSKDAKEWISKGNKRMGADILRVKVKRAGDKYRLSFAGDNRLRWLTAWKIIGGITVPLSASDLKKYKAFDAAGNFTVGGLVKIIEHKKLTLLAGGLFGRRQYGQDRWENWTVTVSGRLIQQQTASVDEKWYGYVFVNRLSKKVVFASGSVFRNATEMREVCKTVTDGRCDNFNDLSRTTGGLGVTWSRVNVKTDKKNQVDFFFEAGTQTWAPFNEEKYGTKVTEPVFRIGVGWGRTVSKPGAIRPVELYLGALGYKGLWDIGLGTEGVGIHRPNYLPSYVQGLQGIKGRGAWGVMFTATLKW